MLQNENVLFPCALKPPPPTTLNNRLSSYSKVTRCQGAFKMPRPWSRLIGYLPLTVVRGDCVGLADGHSWTRVIFLFSLWLGPVQFLQFHEQITAINQHRKISSFRTLKIDTNAVFFSEINNYCYHLPTLIDSGSYCEKKRK